jgi:hypothetical protein
MSFIFDFFPFLNILIYKYINISFLLNFILFYLFIYNIYKYYKKGNFAYKMYIYDFLYKCNFESLLWLNKENNNIFVKFSNFFFIKLIDLFLNFIEYYFFFLSTFFVYPELLF